MKVDLFVAIPGEPLPYVGGYGLIESIDFIPVLHAYWYSDTTNKTYQVMSLLQTKMRTIAICIESAIDVQPILNIPGAFDGPDVCYPSCLPVLNPK